MIITIGGNLGAGKTTLANNLANELHYAQLYVGGIFRDMAAEKNLTIEQFYAQLKDDPAVEQEVDQRQATMMREKDDLIVQGRVAWYFAKSSPFKVFNILLTVSPVVGAERVGEKKENVGKTADEVTIATTEREKMERERYKMLYAIENHLDPKQYDFVLDTTSLTEQEVFDKVLWLVKARLS
ncbi:MAG TPA: cytidylate kinase family protein [Candidatus Paceibacterota bacterium]